MRFRSSIMVRSGIVEMEKMLLTYFSQSKMRNPALWSSARALQNTVSVNAMKHVEQLLYPPLVEPSLKTSSSPSAPGATQGGADSNASSHSPLTLVGMETSLPLFRETNWKAPDGRTLSNRFSNHWESSKEYGFAEVGVSYVEDTVKSLWGESIEAWRALWEIMRSFPDVPTSQDTRLSVCLPDTVLVLVLFSTTRHQIGVGDNLYRIAHKVRCLVQETTTTTPTMTPASSPSSSSFSSSPGSHPRRDTRLFAHILRVFVLGVGLRSHVSPRALRFTSSSEQEMARELADTPPDVHLFPHAGVYTLQSVLSSLAQLPIPHIETTSASAAGPRKSAENPAEYVSQKLKPLVYVLSDGWVHPRNCAAAHKTPTCPIEVFPGVVSNVMTAVELDASARYIAAQVARLPEE